MRALLLAAAAMSALSTGFERGIETFENFGRGIRDLGPDPTESLRYLGRGHRGSTQGARYNRRLKNVTRQWRVVAPTSHGFNAVTNFQHFVDSS